eukprot:CAMPEP_0174849746 /NCGR_PEP_ID=MMETSP1114-20130205/17188_1 /TAXON_ID=312471 /ORGANISM="Neobodo designis, Strain CCAP 1951/1" /LENGTH=480 /DNA_ID=CAMNT_0016084141 /DNA_START=34 /DNA_END=1476 /DNA_ORIENTATION=-
MMRRHASMARAAAGRSIAAWGLHPNMDADMSDETHFPARAEAVPAPVRVSKLPNGARVITHDLKGPHVAVGAYLDAGAKYDPATAPGLSYVMRWALSSSNMDNSIFQQDRLMRAHGAAREHTEVRKRFIGLKMETMAGGHWQNIAHDIFTSVSAPRMPEWDVERFRDTFDNLLEEMRWNDPRTYCVDQVETVAYFREPLGNPRHVAPEMNAAASHAALIQQWAALCSPSRVVIAGVNIDHDALVAAYENAPFPHSAEAPHHKNAQKQLPTVDERNQYHGGERVELEDRANAMKTKPDMDKEGIVAIAFPTFGAETNPKGFAAALVARELLAASLGESVAINQEPTHFGVESFYRPYAGSGLIGATIRDEPGAVQAHTLDAAAAVKGLATTPAALDAAKARAIARFANDHLDVARDYVDFLGTSLIGESLHRYSPDETFANVAAVDASAIKAMTDGFKTVRPSMFATGDVATLPSLRQMGL